MVVNLKISAIACSAARMCGSVEVPLAILPHAVVGVTAHRLNIGSVVDFTLPDVVIEPSANAVCPAILCRSIEAIARAVPIETTAVGVGAVSASGVRTEVVERCKRVWVAAGDFEDGATAMGAAIVASAIFRCSIVVATVVLGQGRVGRPAIRTTTAEGVYDCVSGSDDLFDRATVRRRGRTAVGSVVRISD